MHASVHRVYFPHQVHDQGLDGAMLQQFPTSHPHLEVLLNAAHELGAGDPMHTIAAEPFPRFDLLRGQPKSPTQKPDQIALYIFQDTPFRMHGETAVLEGHEGWIMWL